MCYLPFYPKAEVNYYFIIALYKIAKYDPIEKTKNTIKYNSIK